MKSPMQLGSDWMIYQNLDDLVRACKGDVETDFSNFDCSCFDGVYVTGGITDEYLDRIEKIRSDKAKGVRINLTIVNIKHVPLPLRRDIHYRDYCRG